MHAVAIVTIHSYIQAAAGTVTIPIQQLTGKLVTDKPGQDSYS